MILQGTVVNIVAVAVGCLVGHLAGQRISARMRRTLIAGLGLAVLLVGIQLALQSKQIMVVIGSLILGGLLGEWIGIEQRLEAFGGRLQKKFKRQGKLAEGFVTASLLYCVGAMAVMGALQDGLGHSPDILYAKAVLDGIASIALTATLGVGVAFSIVPLFLYQGGLTLLAGVVSPILTEPAVAEMNAVGGLLIVAIAFDLLEIKRLPVGNLLPAVFIALAFVCLIT